MSRLQGAKISGGTSLAVQWLGLCAPIAGAMGSIPGWGAKITQAEWQKKKKKKKRWIYRVSSSKEGDKDNLVELMGKKSKINGGKK